MELNGCRPELTVSARLRLRPAAGGGRSKSSRSLNIAPAGWEKTYYALRDWQNTATTSTAGAGLDDPERPRDVQPGPRTYISVLAASSPPRFLSLILFCPALWGRLRKRAK